MTCFNLEKRFIHFLIYFFLHNNKLQGSQRSEIFADCFHNFNLFSPGVSHRINVFRIFLTYINNVKHKENDVNGNRQITVTKQNRN